MSFRVNKNILLVLSITLFILINISCVLSNEFISNKEELAHMDEYLQLTVELNKERYSLGESISIKCKIMNLKKEPVNFKLLLSSDISVYIKHEDEKESSLLSSFILPRELLNKNSIIKIGSGGSHLFEKIIFKEAYFMPKRIGKYELYIIYRNGMKVLGGINLWVGKIKSNTVTFEIM